MKLTAETEGFLRAGISTELLPKTFRDAVLVTRVFSVAHPWIDSLCIYQDSAEDWQKESAIMGKVYSNATCNIAASKAADSSEGLFSKRDPTSECAFWVRTTWQLTTASGYEHPQGDWQIVPCLQWTSGVEESTLNRRAWVMQERLLSTRVLHFSDRQVFWECLENIASENFPSTIPSLTLPKLDADIYEVKRHFLLPQREEEREEGMYRAWQAFVVNYDRCIMSQESDKLVAINGIRRLVLDRTGNDLCCGLWRHRLMEELCWYSDSRYKVTDSITFPRNWRAPTWSWAGNNVATFQSDMRLHARCPTFRERAIVDAIYVDELDSGQLKDASLTLRGKILYASCVIESRFSGRVTFICGSSKIIGHNLYKRKLRVILDDPKTALDFQGDIVCLGLLSCESSKNNLPPLRYLEALALVPGECDQYKRIGMVMIPESCYDFYITNESEEEYRLLIV